MASCTNKTQAESKTPDNPTPSYIGDYARINRGSLDEMSSGEPAEIIRKLRRCVMKSYEKPGLTGIKHIEHTNPQSGETWHSKERSFNYMKDDRDMRVIIEEIPEERKSNNPNLSVPLISRMIIINTSKAYTNYNEWRSYVDEEMDGTLDFSGHSSQNTNDQFEDRYEWRNDRVLNLHMRNSREDEYYKLAEEALRQCKGEGGVRFKNRYHHLI